MKIELINMTRTVLVNKEPFISRDRKTREVTLSVRTDISNTVIEVILSEDDLERLNSILNPPEDISGSKDGINDWNDNYGDELDRRNK